MELPSISFPVILLAAGASARMRGRDKLMEQIDGIPLIRRQAQMARAACSGPLVIALPPRPHARYAALAGIDATLLPVPDAAEGMNASLRCAFAALPDASPAAMVLLCDLPDLTADDLKTVGNVVDLNSEVLIWRGVTQTGQPGHPIVFASALFGLFSTLTGDHGGRDVVRHAGENLALVPLPGNRARRDLDTPEDWADWRAENT